jgi:hypothetical protein
LATSEPAFKIYYDLIQRIRAKIRLETEITVDFATGIQRKYLHGKLISYKKLRPTLRLPSPKPKD